MHYYGIIASSQERCYMKRHAKEVIDATLKITAGIALPLGLASMITGFAVANSTDYWQANKPDNEATAQAVQTVEDKEVAGDLKVKFQNGDITYMEYKNELEKIKPQAEAHQEIINSVSNGTVKVEYSDENVPYTPKKFLSISLKGIQENDFAMIIGFPGRTTRFMTSEEAKEAQNISNRISIFTRGVRQDILMEDMNSDPKINIQYADKYTSSSNAWKKWIGMNETFDKLDVVQRRAEEEELFDKWVSENPSRSAKYGNAIGKINGYIKNRAGIMAASRYLTETLDRIELTSIAGYANRKNVSEERMENFYKDYSMPTDRKVASAMIKIYRDSVESRYQPDIMKTIDNEFGGDVEAYLDSLYSNSVFTSMERYNGAKADSALIASDPATAFYNSVREKKREVSNEINKGYDTYSEGKREYLAGILEMNGDKASYPDANSTMRLTYGQVLSYSPRDAVEYDYYTTLDGVMQKEEPGSREFTVPAKLKELWKNKDYGRYAMENGKMPVAFLTNNDITGGNSGSPVLNANGELLGLAFDGNWEAMSGDVIFEPELQRCIAVDIRYVLFIIDKFGGADYLLKEMNLVR